MRTLSFYGAGVEAGRVAKIYNADTMAYKSLWPAMREALAQALGCPIDLLLCDEEYFVGDSAEVVRLDGVLIGALNRRLSSEDVCLIDEATQRRRDYDRLIIS